MDHCIVCPPSTYVYQIPFGIFKLLSVNNCIFHLSFSLDFHQNLNQSSPTSYGWIIVLSVLLQPTFTKNSFGIFKLLSVNICIFHLSVSLDFPQNLNQSSPTSYGWIIVLHVLLQPTFTKNSFGIFKLLSVNIYIFHSFCSIDFNQNVNHSSATSYGRMFK